MSKPAEIWRRLIHLGRKAGVDGELAEEMRQHVELKIETNIRAGLSPEQARRDAQREFGNQTRLYEESRELWGWGLLESLFKDFRYAMRSLRKTPGITAVAILTLSLGIGANTAIFSVVNSALLRPLSYYDPQRLYLVREIVPQIAKEDLDANLPDFRIWQEQVHSFAGVAIAESTSANLTGAGESKIIRGVRASSNILDVLGVRPALGRTFRREEDETGLGHVVILTDSFWRERFQSDPSAIGKSITLDGSTREIIGVLPASFRFPRALGGSNNTARIAFFAPLNGPMDYERDLIGEFDFAAVARLKPGVLPDQALAELNLVQSQIAKQDGGHVDLSASMKPLEAVVVGPARSGLVFLLAAVGAVLLIVCVNLASLLLARAPGRMREAAIRTALGATSGRIMRQLLTETFVLSLVGGALGVWIASFSVQWLVHLAPPTIPRMDEVQLDVRALLFAMVLVLATGSLFGILPAWRISRSQPLEALKSGGAASTESSRTRRLRESLVGFEVGLTTTLLILAGLLISSLGQILHVRAGFTVQNVLIAGVDLPPQSYSQPAARLRFYDTVLAAVRSLPDVRAAGWISIPPLAGEGSVTGMHLPGAQQTRALQPMANYRPVGPEYFSAMGIPLLKGRAFGPADKDRKMVMISENIAELFWPGKDPVGQIIVTEWAGDVPCEVVGVVGDIRTVRLDDQPLMMVYVPSWFNKISIPGSASIVLSTTGDPARSAASVRALVHKIDPDVPLTSLNPMTEIVSQSVDARRFPMLLALTFAVSSLLLASLGIFGVVGYSVEQRRQELGIRLALGAQPRDLLGMVVRHGMAPVLVGLSGGVVTAILAGRLINSLLFGVTAYDPLTLLSVCFSVAGVSLLACYIPARRVTRLDPLVALRYE
jgi:putative ABC transport system permease protein